MQLRPHRRGAARGGRDTPRPVRCPAPAPRRGSAAARLLGPDARGRDPFRK